MFVNVALLQVTWKNLHTLSNLTHGPSQQPTHMHIRMCMHIPQYAAEHFVGRVVEQKLNLSSVLIFWRLKEHHV